jgi:transposase InsO family protein
MDFIMEYTGGLSTMAELCRVYKISRQTGYKWTKRFKQEKLRGLQDRSHASVRHPNQTRRWIERRLLELRGEHPRWGPRKLKAYLCGKYSKTAWPAASTIGALLKREGLTIPRRKRRKTPPYTEPFREVKEPNQVWCVDFKGWFRTGDGERIDPLTMTDACSRFLLRCQAVEKTDTRQVLAIFESAFREYGMPWAIRSDNGPPFASHAIAGISRLSVYLMKLGIVPERIQPGHPEQNGRHERMHRTLGEETANPPAENRRAQQKSFDRFKGVYNEERPHEALRQKTPRSCYQVSGRPYPERVKEPEYPDGMQVRRVLKHGDFKWKTQRVFLSESLARESVGFEAIDERYYKVYFARFPLGRFDSQKLRVDPLPVTPKPGAGHRGDGRCEAASRKEN